MKLKPENKVDWDWRIYKRQLELLYPGKHRLTIKDMKDNFAVQLQLDL